MVWRFSWSLVELSCDGIQFDLINVGEFHALNLEEFFSKNILIGILRAYPELFHPVILYVKPRKSHLQFVVIY